MKMEKFEEHLATQIKNDEPQSLKDTQRPTSGSGKIRPTITHY